MNPGLRDTKPPPRPSRWPSAVGAALFVGILGAHGPAEAAPTSAPTKQACADAATRGQVYRDDLKFTSASSAFSLCSDLRCPEAVRGDCVKWLEEVRQRMPTLRILVAHAEGEEALEGLELRVDDVVVQEGSPVSLDPGPHTIRVQARGRPPVVKPISLAERDRKEISVPLPPIPASTDAGDAPSARPIPLPVWILGGVSILGLGSFTYFGLTAKSESDRLESECSPACPTAERDAAFRRAVVADVSLAVSVLAAGGAAYFFFTRPRSAETLKAAVTPNRHGATVGVSGAF